jgi:hypothetical protein
MGFEELGLFAFTSVRNSCPVSSLSSSLPESANPAGRREEAGFFRPQAVSKVFFSANLHPKKYFPYRMHFTTAFRLL